MSWQRTLGLAWTAGRAEDGDVIRIATFPGTTVYTLAGGATLIWVLLDEPMGRDDLLATIAAQTGVQAGEIVAEVDACLSELAGLGLATEAA
ncbi:MAG: PqqD family protein [Acidipropionibacterium acidipropionici]|jgi:hypothetical protein|uniref:PqqD family protein n=1 Tax=Acidipropionibacterium acidipropionici TaxID=1748 RepID=UPI002F3523CF